MKINKLRLTVSALFGIGLIFFESVPAKEIGYVGGGRYICQGSGCDKFDRQQEERNRISEANERYHRENRQDNQRIIDELKKSNESK